MIAVQEVINVQAKIATRLGREMYRRQSWRDHKSASQAFRVLDWGLGLGSGPGILLRAAEGERTMIDWTERKRYWRDTKWQMVATLAPFLLAVLVVPLYAEALNSKRVLGMPLGYFAVCHGLLVVAAIVIASFVNRQDAIDHWHGANEDP
jgi:putative solute:sodium symporter small subunit